MKTPKRQEISLEKIFNRILLVSFLLHSALGLLFMTVEPPPPPNQDEYADFIKKFAPPKVEEPEPEPEPEPEVKKEEEKPEEEEMAEVPTAAPTKRERATAKAAAPGEQERRAEVRKQLSGAGLLAVIGGASDEEGGLANVFESGAVVGKDLSSTLSERGGVRVSGGTRIGQKGALGAGTSADIGDVEAGAGGSAGDVGGRAGIVPKAFVKSGEAVIKKGAIDEKGVKMALRRRERGIQQCYERALKTNSNLKGKLVLQWTINEEGKVVKIASVQNTLGDKKVEDCVMDIIKRIRFPKATKGLVPVRKTFVFEAG